MNVNQVITNFTYKIKHSDQYSNQQVTQTSDFYINVFNASSNKVIAL